MVVVMFDFVILFFGEKEEKKNPTLRMSRWSVIFHAKYVRPFHVHSPS